MDDPLAQTCRTLMDKVAYEVDGIWLTRTELAIINYLKKYLGPQTQERIAYDALDYRHPGFLGTIIRQHVAGIRRKLGVDCIVTHVPNRYEWVGEGRSTYAPRPRPTHQWRGLDTPFGTAPELAGRWNTGCHVICQTEDVRPARVLVEFEDGYRVVAPTSSIKVLRIPRDLRPAPRKGNQ